MSSPPLVSHPVVFDEFGQFIDRPGFNTLLAFSDDEHGSTDVFDISHGWKNNFADASQLYNDLLAQLTAVSDAEPGLRPADYRPLAIGVVWPAKAWDEEMSQCGGGD